MIGLWNVYDGRRRRFVQRTCVNQGRYNIPIGVLYVTWTSEAGKAKGYKQQSFAARMAARLNTQVGKKVCRVVGEAEATEIERENLRAMRGLGT